MIERNKIKESEISKAISDYLQLLENQGKLLFIRNNSFAGTIMRKDGSKGYVKNNKPGASDFIVWIPGRGADRWLHLDTIFLEVKSSSGKLLGDQLAFEQQVKRLGGQYHVVRSVEEVQKILSL